jgi:hypothetical protein
MSIRLCQWLAAEADGRLPQMLGRPLSECTVVELGAGVGLVRRWD